MLVTCCSNEMVPIGEFNLKDGIPATSASTLNATGKSATIGQSIGRSRKRQNISLKKKTDRKSKLISL